MRTMFPALGRAVKGPPPRPGEHFRTRIADSKDGIIFEIGRMVETVRYQMGDALVNDQAGWNISMWAELQGLDENARRSPLEMARAQFHWTRGATQYVPDPHRMEKLQTGNRMVRMSRVPRQIVMASTAPIYASLKGIDLGSVTLADLPRVAVRISADCDEQSTLAATLCATCGIATRFMLGRNQGTEWFHHVWAQADVLGDGSEESFWMGSMDPTEPEFDDVGKYAEGMAAYKPVEIFA